MSSPESSFPTSRLEMWVELINAARWRTVAEIGVWRGEFAEAVLRSCPTVERYYMVDPWRTLPGWNKPANVPQPDFDAIFAEAEMRTGFAADRRRILRMSTVDAAPQIADRSLDFIYIDGDHTLRGIAIDLISWWPKLAPLGAIGGDDFSPSIWQHAPNYEPTLVFPFAVYFAEAVKATIKVLPFDQFLLELTDDGFKFEHGDEYANTQLLPQVRPRRTNILRRMFARMHHMVSQT